jgi:hypothetical protein
LVGMDLLLPIWPKDPLISAKVQRQSNVIALPTRRHRVADNHVPPVFLCGLVGVVLVFANATYLITGSVQRAFLATVICAVLLQVGYFAVVLFMVWRTRPAPERSASEKGDDEQPLR